VRRENSIAHHYREADDQIVRGPSQRSMQGVVNILAGIGQIPQGSPTGWYFQLTYLNQALQELGR
jgi:hypothetical protein